MGGERLKRRSISSGRFVLNSLVLANGPALAPVDRNRDFARDRRAAQRPALEPEIGGRARSEEHTSELQSLMRISYAVFCLKKKKKQKPDNVTPLEDRSNHNSEIP